MCFFVNIFYISTIYPYFVITYFCNPDSEGDCQSFCCTIFALKMAPPESLNVHNMFLNSCLPFIFGMKLLIFFNYTSVFFIQNGENTFKIVLFIMTSSSQKSEIS